MDSMREIVREVGDGCTEPTPKNECASSSQTLPVTDKNEP